MKKIILLSMLFSYTYITQAQSNQCGTAEFIYFDSTNTISYPAGVNTPAAPPSGNPGPMYGCLSTQTNPKWFVMQVVTSGNIEIYMQGSGPYDIDFVCWGPFSSPTAPCLLGLTADSITPSHHASGISVDYPSANMIDCSYNASFEEWCYIPGAITGKYYILMITNFANQNQNIVFSQSNANQAGAGSISCDQNLPGNTSSNSPVCSGDTLKLNSSVINAQYSWIGPNNFSSNLQNPVILNVTPANSGVYQLFLTDCFQHLHNYLVQTQVDILPFSALQYTIVNQNVVFSNFSLYSNSSFWDFGDGNSSNLLNPSHNYDTTGTYNVTLYSYNNCGYDSVSEQISISGMAISEFENQSVVISPNPFCDKLSIENKSKYRILNYEFIQADGKIIYCNKMAHPEIISNFETINTSLFQKGIYFLKIQTNINTFIVKLVKL